MLSFAGISLLMGIKLLEILNLDIYFTFNSLVRIV